jgi:hypothetical protein
MVNAAQYSHLVGQTVVGGKKAAELLKENLTRRGVAVGPGIEPLYTLLNRT